MFVNSESPSKLPMNKTEPCSNISLEKWNESLTSMVIKLRTGARNLANLCAGVFKVDRTGLIGGKRSTNFLLTILNWYMITSRVPFGLREWYLSADSFYLRNGRTVSLD